MPPPPPALRLAEATVNLIIAYLTQNLPSALAVVAGARAGEDNLGIVLEPPQEFFIYEKPTGYKPPSIIVICREFDFRLREKQANTIAALAHVNVEAVLQDRDRTRLTPKAWRYQCAMVHLLDNAELTNTDGSVKLITKVVRTPFSGDYAKSDKNPGDPVNVFRKAVMIELEVEHYEKKV